MGIPIQRKGWLTLAAAVGLLCAAAPSLHAQGGTIRGTVVETGNRQPLAGATVAGGGRSTVTDAAGEFTLAEVPAGRVQVRASRLGYQAGETSVSVAAGATARADLALAPAALGLDAIVVTGTAGVTSRRTIPNSVTSLDVAQITERTTVGDVTEILQGRTPGVQILSNSGTPGAAADIRIRGAGSLTAVRPVIYVDGIRYSDADLGNFGASGGAVTSFSTQVTSALSFINPEDIESIEVIKGPAAATLYGAEAAGGVIQVITKKGTRGSQRTQWSAKVEYGQNQLRSDLPDNFTVCTTARLTETVSATNPAPRWPGCQGQQAGYVIREESPILNDPFGVRDGDVRRLNLSVRGGGDRFSYFVSGDMDEDNGVFYNSFNNRRSVRANFTATANERLDFQFSTNFVRNHLRLPIGDESAQGLLFLSVRGRPGRFTGFPEVFAGYPGSVGGLQANEYNNQTRSDRTTLGGTANYRPFPWFRNRVTLGLDLTRGDAQILSTPGSTDAQFGEVPEGIVAIREPEERYYTADYVGTAELPITDWLESSTSVGVNYIARRRETLTGTGRGLGAPDITTIQSAAFSSSSNTYLDNKSIGYYIQEQLGFNNRLFLTGALRADDNSSFGREFDVIVYPKAGFSWVVSEEPRLESFFQRFAATQVKVRGAYGQAGRAPDPYSANQTYTVVKVTAPTATGVTTVNGIRSVGFGNPNLEPERGEEYELGFEAGFLDDRVTLDFTYYDKRTDNLLQNAAVAPSTGFISSQLTNLGNIRNTGVEFLLNLVPVQRDAFTWESRFNLATNQNELVSFGDEARVRADAAFQAYGTVQEHRVGHPIAGFWARLPMRDDAGNIQFAANNLPLMDTAFTYLGSPTPSREIGWGNTITLFRNVTLFAQLDYKGGFKVFNRKEFDRCRPAAAENCERLNDIRYFEPKNAADSALIREVNVYRGSGVNFATGATLTNLLFSPYVEDGDFLKLRDVSISVGLPRALVARSGASGATFTLAARNLATLWTRYSGIDPEANTYGNRSFVRVDAYAAPQNRRVTASLNINF
ncbi:MAG TPA: SusC/RagA family TonB-linked outer membrane protein [Longimicrobium sp.]|jgi:TonB-linked SusC/RagA family outer membrane protein|uniref:SusC/RagA family TonB-linked outer membrane protein n=1 Tax=Longimicrobium sp. TaxID=2029185 RepID=UPI002EDB6CEF